MKLNKKCFIQFGYYGSHPKDESVYEINFPEDTIFFTGGENDIGDGKHVGAFHVLAMTKASDKEIYKVIGQCWSLRSVEVGMFKTKIFRVNGYAFIELSDCISNEFVFTDVDKVNELLDLKNHPVYIVYLNEEYMISHITRINRINSYYNVDIACIQLRSQIGNRYLPMIQPNDNTELSSIIIPFHKCDVYLLDESYGKELFDEMLYIALSDIYPEYNKKLKGFDLEYINKCYTNLLNLNKTENNKILENFNVPSNIENIKNFNEKLPIKNEKFGIV